MFVSSWWPLPWPWGYVYGGFPQFGAIIAGLLLIVVGLLYLAHGLLGAERGPLRGLLRIAPVTVVNGLASGLMVGIGLALAGGLVLTLGPWGFGSLVAPDNLRNGLIMGLGCGVVFASAVPCIRRLPPGLALGTTVGLAGGLAGFRLFFGPTAGVGPETDSGAGPEVGLVLGMLGALVGGLVGVLLDSAREPSASGTSRARHGLATGLWIGASISLAVALVGSLTGVVSFILPYYGGVTDRCSSPTVCGPQLPFFSADVWGIIYGLALFTVGGALVGGLTGVLLDTWQRSDNASPHWAGVAAGMVAGLAAGLAAGLQHRVVGGPLFVGARFVSNPMAGATGLVSGVVAGLVIGALCALVLARAQREQAPRTVAVGIVLIVVGLVAWTLSSWFMPLIAIDVP
jgi:hypothetical protein